MPVCTSITEHHIGFMPVFVLAENTLFRPFYIPMSIIIVQYCPYSPPSAYYYKLANVDSKLLFINEEKYFFLGNAKTSYF